MRGELRPVLDQGTVERETEVPSRITDVARQMTDDIGRDIGVRIDPDTGEWLPPAEAGLTIEQTIEYAAAALAVIESDMALLRAQRAGARAQLKEVGVSLKAFDRAREELRMHDEKCLDAYRTQCRFVRRVLQVPEQLELLVES